MMKEFNEALRHLGIEDYSERIFNSSSQGELFHLADYIHLATIEGDVSWFRDWFDWIVKLAEDQWQRPESVFQHIPRCLKETI